MTCKSLCFDWFVRMFLCRLKCVQSKYLRHSMTLTHIRRIFTQIIIGGNKTKKKKHLWMMLAHGVLLRSKNMDLQSRCFVRCLRVIKNPLFSLHLDHPFCLEVFQPQPTYNIICSQSFPSPQFRCFSVNCRWSCHLQIKSNILSNIRFVFLSLCIISVALHLLPLYPISPTNQQLMWVMCRDLLRYVTEE